MKYFLISDIHIDFYIDLWNRREPIKDYADSVPYFEQFFKMYMDPYADACIIAGDIANDYYTAVNFLRWVGTKYSDVFVVFGNHDLTVRGHTFGNGNPQKRSDTRMRNTISALKDSPNVHMLCGDVLSHGDIKIGGTMGMCDFSMGWNRMDCEMRWKFNWYDGVTWKYMGNEPKAILKSECERLDHIVDMSPGIVITHFAPSQLGVHRDYDGSASNAFFFFDASAWLDRLPDGAVWVCGHIHNCMMCDYLNSHGAHIRIIAMPNGYPGEDAYDGYRQCMSADRERGIERSAVRYSESSRMLVV